ncbi:MAG TPA: DinB family protein, partial [bacterium]|nr:DinB family protein [bacterium]
MRPTKDEYPSFFETYVSKVPDGDIVQQMRQGVENTVKLISPLSDDLLNYRYAEGKWSIKEVLMHLSDAERIFSYRALRFARKDKTDLPGFDENIYVPASKATQRTA